MTTILLFKPGVNPNGIKAPTLRALAVATEVWQDHGVAECWVTSLLDGHHSATSLHPKGLAGDLRTHNVRDEGRDPVMLAASLRERLGPDYDVILEYTGTENEHIHFEHDPKPKKGRI